MLVGGWLILITSRQVALFPPAAAPAREILPVGLAGGLVVAAAVVRIARPSVPAQVALLVVLTFALAHFAAQLGQPLANATADYCGDGCRTAIMGRFVTFFGWPILAALAFGIVARSEGRRPGEAAAERGAWTRVWAIVTLAGGMAAAAAWWRIILPNG